VGSVGSVIGLGCARTIALLVCIASFGVVVAPATAAVGPFGSEGEAAGQFSQPRGIAVNQESGDVYVADRNNRRVDKFGPDGEFLLAWGWGVANGAPEAQTCGPEASSPSATCQSGIAGEGPGQFGEQSASGVAIDNDSLDMSDGDVYVEDSANHRIEKFGPDGEFILMFGGEVNRTTKADVCLDGEECKAGAVGGAPGDFDVLLPSTISASSTGTVYVGDSVAENGRVQEFGEGGSLEGEIALAGSGGIHAVVVGSGEEVYVLSEVLDGVREYDAAGGEVGEPRDPSVTSFGTVVALGPSSELYVFNGESGHVLEYDSAGTEVASLDESDGGEPSQGIAFGDGVKGLYVLYESTVRFAVPPAPGPVAGGESSSEVLPTTATIGAVVNAEGHETTYHFEFGATEAYGSSTATETLPGGEGFEDQRVSAHLTNLQPRTEYHFRVVASNECEPIEHPGAICTVDGPDETFETLPPVSIDSESLSQVTSVSVRLEAAINPHGLATEFHFEYGRSASYEASLPVPAGETGDGTADVSVSLLVEGLTPGTTYHYRVVADNSAGTVDGPDQVFATQTGGAVRLMDGRAWEMVSPPEKHGSSLESLTQEGGVIQAAQDGSGLAYIAKAPVVTQPAGSRSLADTQLLATRTGGVWGTQDIATAHEAVAGIVAGRLSEYRLFSPDLSSALVEPEGSSPLSVQASERTPYLRHDTTCQESQATCYQPLVTGCPPPGELCQPAVQELEDVPPGTKFGALEIGGVRSASTGVEFVAATPDLSHVVLSAPQTLTEGFDAGMGEEALYEWSAGKPPTESLAPVSILPGEESAAAQGGASLGSGGADVRNAISEDGSRVFFESNQSHLFVRDMEKGQTVQLDAPQEGAAGGISAGEFEDASANGAKAFFMDTARLTPGATSKTNEPDLYMCTVGEAAGRLTCTLQDLTIDPHPGEAANAQGAVLGASETGELVYFVANGALTEGEGATPGAFNLYVRNTVTDRTRLVAVLSNADGPDWEAGGGNHNNLGELSARVSANGRYLAFMSQRSLTGFDNRDAISGEPDEEVYLYDEATGRLACASCDPTGARPVGVFDVEPGFIPPLLVDRTQLWGGRGLAGSIPGWTSVEKVKAIYQSRYLDDDGRLFFDSPVDLVSQDANGVEDVYEYEPQGVGPQAARCGPEAASGSEAFKPERVAEVQGRAVAEGAGCVGLVSSGASGEESAFLDASGMGPGGEEGEDVFFLTAAKLSPADADSDLDVYDAHVCSAVAPCPVAQASLPPACAAVEACRAAGSSQPATGSALPTATSVAPEGNVAPPPPAKAKSAAQVRAEKLAKALKACRAKRNRHKREACESQALKRYGPIKAGHSKAKKAGRGARRGK